MVKLAANGDFLEVMIITITRIEFIIYFERQKKTKTPKDETVYTNTVVPTQTVVAPTNSAIAPPTNTVVTNTSQLLQP
ncbi:MAG: hypothetical protein IPH32_15560 [Bacteroidetes bacterium]|nr:hypothetical protein [Bacteroidota bacterium]